MSKVSQQFILFILGLTLSASALRASSPGESAAQFLKIGMGARGVAMGDAQSALADDVSAAYWNPAGLNSLRFKEISLMHNQMVEGVRYQQAAYGFPTQKKGVFSLGASMLDYGSIQGYDEISAPTGNVEASNLLVSLSWAKQMMKTRKLFGGATFKYLKSDLAGYTANAPMLDLGVLVPIDEGRLRGLRLAGAIRNLGSKLKYDVEDYSLPRQIVLGAGLSALGGNLNVGLDLISAADNGTYSALGLEYRVFELLNLRVGYNTKSDFIGNGITYGMGLKFNQWNLDYAFIPFGDLGNTNRVSVNIRFGHAFEIQDAGDQVDLSYRRAEQQLALGNSVKAYTTVSELLLIAPWHKPAAELKAKIEKQFAEMAASKNQAQMDAQIADKFTEAKAAFDRDELVAAKAGFETILRLQPYHVGSSVYLDRIKNRYSSLAYESFKQGMDYFAAGEYEKAKLLFEKTLTIDDTHADAKAQLETTKDVMSDSNRRAEEMTKLAGASGAYQEGLSAYQKNDFELALKKFEDVHRLVPEYEEVGRYLTLTKTMLATMLFEHATVNMENNQLDDAVNKLTRALELNPDDIRIKPALEVASRDLATKNAQDSKKAYQEGLSAYLSGNTAKAENLWNKALELDPSNEDAKAALQKMEEQKAHEKSKQ